MTNFFVFCDFDRFLAKFQSKTLARSEVRLKSPNFYELWIILTYFPSVGGSDRIRVRAAAASSKAQETLEVNLLSTWNDQWSSVIKIGFVFKQINGFVYFHGIASDFSARVFKNSKKLTEMISWLLSWEPNNSAENQWKTVEKILKIRVWNWICEKL